MYEQNRNYLFSWVECTLPNVDVVSMSEMFESGSVVSRDLKLVARISARHIDVSIGKKNVASVACGIPVIKTRRRNHVF